jgi:hypothetical protein
MLTYIDEEKKELRLFRHPTTTIWGQSPQEKKNKRKNTQARSEIEEEEEGEEGGEEEEEEEWRRRTIGGGGEEEEEEESVVRWDLLIRELTGGNFFVGLGDFSRTLALLML